MKITFKMMNSIQYMIQIQITLTLFVNKHNEFKWFFAGAESKHSLLFSTHHIISSQSRCLGRELVRDDSWSLVCSPRICCLDELALHRQTLCVLCLFIWERDTLGAVCQRRSDSGDRDGVCTRLRYGSCINTLWALLSCLGPCLSGIKNVKILVAKHHLRLIEP